MKKQLFCKIGLCLLVFCLVSTGIVAATTVDLPERSYNNMINKVITENVNGKTISINEGDVFYLKLKDNSGSTGYSWHLSMSRGLKLLSDKYYPDKSVIGEDRIIDLGNDASIHEMPIHIVGVGGHRVWKIKAVTKGYQQIEGVCSRSWEPVTGNEQTFTLNVKVVHPLRPGEIPLPEPIPSPEFE